MAPLQDSYGPCPHGQKMKQEAQPDLIVSFLACAMSNLTLPMGAHFLVKSEGGVNWLFEPN